MSVERHIENLQSVESLRALEFYVIEHTNRWPQLECRLHGFPGGTKAGMEEFAAELNAAIRPIIDARAATLLKVTADTLPRTI